MIGSLGCTREAACAAPMGDAISVPVRCERLLRRRQTSEGLRNRAAALVPAAKITKRGSSGVSETGRRRIAIRERRSSVSDAGSAAQ
jgi:hypothetical protein